MICLRNSLFFALLTLIFACAGSQPSVKPGAPRAYKVHGNWYQPLTSAEDFTEKGRASWYGKKFHGRKTANGEVYNMYAMTAAHKTLPLGTTVKVRNLDNNREIVVRINDRGPFVRGRIIDLSYTGAKKLGVIGPGTAPVEVTALARTSGGKGEQALAPVDFSSGNFTIQVGAFQNLANAENLRDKLSKVYGSAHISKYDRGDVVFYRVRAGRYNTVEKAEKYENILISKGFTQAFAVGE